MSSLDLLDLHALDPESFPVLLQTLGQSPSPSPSKASAIAQYDSLLFTAPRDKLILHADGTLTGPHSEQGSFLQALNSWFQAERKPKSEAAFCGGWCLYLGYELANEIEPTAKVPTGEAGWPIAYAWRMDGAVVQHGDNVQIMGDCTKAHADDIETLIEQLQSKVSATYSVPKCLNLEEENPNTFKHAVQLAKQYVFDGDIFQANLSRRWTATMAKANNTLGIYSALRTNNPGPFAGIFRFDSERAIVSSSPERLVKSDTQWVQVRPIAGTRPRGDGDADQAFKDELMKHPKERAEHIMLLDLERNDLGRLSQPGSVVVDEFMVLETYQHVHHIVSNVKGRLQPDVLPGDIIAAVFPGGTITGCPKVRAMQIIGELEQRPRGAYTGSMGYLSLDGQLDLNILIRSAMLTGDQLTLNAGAGIVADSDPEHELQETRAKAKGLLAALGVKLAA